MNAELDRKALRDLSYGLYIVTSRDGEKLNGQIVNTVIQVTSDPPRVAVIINKKNMTHELITKSNPHWQGAQGLPLKRGSLEHYKHIVLWLCFFSILQVFPFE